jgi:hypothetical protein
LLPTTESAPPRFLRKDLEACFSEMHRRLQVQLAGERQRDRQVASSFTVFRFFETNENLLSDMLTFLLDPRETHGQQTLFLNLFARRLNREVGDAAGNIKVAREAVTYSILKYRRRIDVLVNSPNLVIAIENKVDAEEQEEQLHDYYGHLRQTCRKDYCLVFLTPDGRWPKSLSDKVTSQLLTIGRLFLFSYATDIHSWLTDCQRECEPENIRHFLANMLGYIETHMPKSTSS